MPARAGRDKLEPWNYSFSCWEEKESSVSLADIPLNVIHYCVVTLLSSQAGNWASCRALKYPDGGQDSQHSIKKYESSPTGEAFSRPQSELQIAFTTISDHICEPIVRTNCENKLLVEIQSNQNQAHEVHKRWTQQAVWTDAVWYIMG